MLKEIGSPTYLERHRTGEILQFQEHVEVLQDELHGKEKIEINSGSVKSRQLSNKKINCTKLCWLRQGNTIIHKYVSNYISGYIKNNNKKFNYFPVIFMVLLIFS